MQHRASLTHPIWTPSCCFILDKIPCKLCHNPKFRSKLLIIITNWNSWGSNKGNFIEVAHTRLLWRSRSWLSPVLSPPKHQKCGKLRWNPSQLAENMRQSYRSLHRPFLQYNMHHLMEILKHTLSKIQKIYIFVELEYLSPNLVYCLNILSA